jgi:hypothetical protein
MDLLEAHFSQLDGNLYYDATTGTYEMFSKKGVPKHLNYLTFKKLFESMEGLKNPIILESGIASAGTYSTYLFNEYVRKYGGRFWSVDINRDLVEKHKGAMCPATELVCNDSVYFFHTWVHDHKGTQANVIYLDSWDLDIYHPEPAGLHGLQEYKALRPAIQSGTLLLIDDTPASPYWLDTRGQTYNDMLVYYEQHKSLPGKGMYVVAEPKHATMLLHNYQVLYKF